MLWTSEQLWLVLSQISAKEIDTREDLFLRLLHGATCQQFRNSMDGKEPSTAVWCVIRLSQPGLFCVSSLNVFTSTRYKNIQIRVSKSVKCPNGSYEHSSAGMLLSLSIRSLFSLPFACLCSRARCPYNLTHLLPLKPASPSDVLGLWGDGVVGP